VQGAELTSSRPAPTPAPAGTDHRIGYVPPLDGLRGVAVAAVMFFHGGYLLGGFLSVDVFFVLSGFLITTLLLAETTKTGRINLGKFWSRRARRLLPALFVMLAGVSLYAAFVASPNDLNTIRGDALATLLYFANWHAIIGHRGYWTLFQSPSPLEHAWSLAIEEQFYLLWPLVVFALAWFTATRKRERSHRRPQLAPKVLVVALTMAAISPILMWVLTPRGSDPSLIYVRTDTRVGTILLGGALAAWIAWRGPIRRTGARVALEVAAILGAVYIGYAWVTTNGQQLGVYHGGFFLFDLAALAVLAAAAHPRTGPVARVLSVKPLRALGIISYGLYLWHWPVYTLLNPVRMGFGGHPLLFLRIFVSLLFGIASYYLVELPIRSGRFLPKRKFYAALPIGATACAVAIVMSTAAATIPAGASAAATFTGAGASTSSAATRVAAASASASGTRMLVVGDSVGVNIGNAAQSLQDGSGLVVDNASIPGCLLAPSSDSFEATLRTYSKPITSFTPCETDWLDNARVFKPTVVAVVYGTGGSFLDPSVGGQFVSACSTTYRSWYTAHLRETIAEFTNVGVRRVILFKLPHVDNENWPDDASTRIDCVNAVHEEVARRTPGVVVLDLADEVCPATRCRTTYFGVPFRDDGLHVTVGAPAQLVGRWLLDETRRVLA
jgi:peptidoglycan/LPS O-acetylase OafA/YrhL